MTVDYAKLMWEEVDDIGLLLHELADEEWDADSLCEGWKVRDVIGHMCYGHTTGVGPILASVVRYKGNMAKGSFELSKRYGAEHSPAELLEVWDVELVDKHTRRGISKVVKYSEGFLDHLIHNQDLRRPLDRPREVPEAHLIAAMDLLPKTNTPLFGTKKGVAGLRLHATDIDHTVDVGGTNGPLIEGPAEALIMAAAGRGDAFAELTGEAVETLRARISA